MITLYGFVVKTGKSLPVHGTTSVATIKDGYVLTDEERARCADVSQIIGSERWQLTIRICWIHYPIEVDYGLCMHNLRGSG